MPATAEKPRTWHYVPLPRYAVDDARRHVDSLHRALRPWIADAAARLAPSEAPAELALHAALTDEAEARCALAAALIACPEWTGHALADALRARGWPTDQALVDAAYKWSFALKRSLVAAWEARGRQRKAHR